MESLAAKEGDRDGVPLQSGRVGKADTCCESAAVPSNGEAQALANNASPKIAERYLRIADEWLSLAHDIEKLIDGLTG